MDQKRLVDCALHDVLQLLTRRWAVHILWVLLNGGPTRFGQLHRHIPDVSTKVLTARLRDLEAARLVSRQYKATVPPEVTYALTARGEQLRIMLVAMNTVAEQWNKEDATVRP
jgi:DNA-binding HxlR family transcriptional regulator